MEYEYLFDAFSLWTARIITGVAILMALGLLGIGVANFTLFLLKLFKGNNRKTTQRQREMLQYVGMYFALWQTFVTNKSERLDATKTRFVE